MYKLKLYAISLKPYTGVHTILNTDEISLEALLFKIYKSYSSPYTGIQTLFGIWEVSLKSTHDYVK